MKHLSKIVLIGIICAFAAQAAAQELPERIKKAGKIIVATKPTYPPSTYKGPATNQLIGLDVGHAGAEWVHNMLTLPAMLAWENDALRESWREVGHEEELGRSRYNGTAKTFSVAGVIDLRFMTGGHHPRAFVCSLASSKKWAP